MGAVSRGIKYITKNKARSVLLVIVIIVLSLTLLFGFSFIKSVDSTVADYKSSLATSFSVIKDPIPYADSSAFYADTNGDGIPENIGPMLSGTASWLSLAVFEFLGAEVSDGNLHLSPVLREGKDFMAYTMHLEKATIHAKITATSGRFRAGALTQIYFDGKPCGRVIPLPTDGQTHEVRMEL